MKKEIIHIDFPSVRKQLHKDAIDDDFMLMDDISAVPFFDYPTKVDHAVATICLKGRIEGGINLKPYSFSENDFFILLPDQIVQYSYISEDFSGLHIVMSKRFIDNLELNLKDAIPVMLHLREHPVMHLTQEEVAHMLDYYYMLQKAVRRTQTLHRMEMIRLLVQAIFYGINDFQLLKQKDVAQKSKREELLNSFYQLILEHYKESREVGFYAGILCLTPKYLSTVIKEISGKSAYEWINDYVVLQAKALLKSTNMTIQQISDELNFTNQSFFGKYFRQHTGMSPKEYRKQ